MLLAKSLGIRRGIRAVHVEAGCSKVAGGSPRVKFARHGREAVLEERRLDLRSETGSFADTFAA